MSLLLGYLNTNLVSLVNFNTLLVFFPLVCEVTLKHKLVAAVDKGAVNNLF